MVPGAYPGQFQTVDGPPFRIFVVPQNKSGPLIRTTHQDHSSELKFDEEPLFAGNTATGSDLVSILCNLSVLSWTHLV